MSKDFDHIETFNIDNMEVQLGIIYGEGKLCECHVIKGDTGMGLSTGGIYSSLREYVDSRVREHKYAYNFFNLEHNKAKVIDRINNMDKWPALPVIYAISHDYSNPASVPTYQVSRSALITAISKALDRNFTADGFISYIDASMNPGSSLTFESKQLLKKWREDLMTKL